MIIRLITFSALILSTAATADYDSVTMAKKALPYAELSNAVYKKENVAGYTLIADENDLLSDMVKSKYGGGFLSSVLAGTKKANAFLSGFEVGLYKKEDEYVLAFTGTDSLADGITDVAQIVWLKPPQYQLAAKITKYLKNKYKSKLVLTGHSLGGGLAQYAAYKNGSTIPTITFNSANVSKLYSSEGNEGNEGNNIININMDHDPVSTWGIGGKQLGTVYEYKNKSYLLEAHKMETVLSNLREEAEKDLKGEAVKLANVNIAKNSVIAIVQSGSSHIGSASFGYQFQNKEYKQQSKTPYESNYKDTIGTPSIPSAAFLAPQEFSQSQWVVTKGSPSKHLSISSSYGSIKPSQGNTIYAINNADAVQTSIQKNFLVPNNVITDTANISSIVKFVTTEYPYYVGSQFNDTGKVTITTPGGKSISYNLLDSSVNNSSFSQATGMPIPLSGFNLNDGAGETAWSSNTIFIPVAPGGTLKVKVEVTNVGDTALPSAVLINKLDVK